MRKVYDFLVKRISLIRLLSWILIRRARVRLGQKVQLYGTPILSCAPGASIEIEDGVVLCSRSEFTALGVNHPVILRATGPGATISIGSHTGISGGVVVAASRVAIGENCLIGADCMIVDNDFHPIRSLTRRYDKDGIACQPVAIEDNVFLGAGTIVLKGVTIGRNSVIGAGSVVTRSVPPNSIAAGNPCVVMSTF